MPQATVAIASPPQRPRSSSPQSSSSTFGTDEPLRLNIGDGPGESGAAAHAAAEAAQDSSFSVRSYELPGMCIATHSSRLQAYLLS